MTTKRNIQQEIQNQINNYKEWKATHSLDNNNQVACVFVQQLSPRKYHVGWRFTSPDTQVGDMQLDAHMSAYRNQEIVWMENR